MESFVIPQVAALVIMCAWEHTLRTRIARQYFSGLPSFRISFVLMALTNICIWNQWLRYSKWMVGGNLAVLASIPSTIIFLFSRRFLAAAVACFMSITILLTMFCSINYHSDVCSGRWSGPLQSAGIIFFVFGGFHSYVGRRFRRAVASPWHMTLVVLYFQMIWLRASISVGMYRHDSRYSEEVENFMIGVIVIDALVQNVNNET